MEQSIIVSLDKRLAEKGIAVTFVLASGEVSTDAVHVCSTAWENAQVNFRKRIEVCELPEKIVEHPHLEGYRDLHDCLDCTSHRTTEHPLIPSPESLIRILLREGSLRALGPIVDLYNTVALKHLVSAGAHDADKLGKRVALAMNTANIRFRPLGQKKKQTLPSNEYSYTTDQGRAICRLECKQAHETKLRPETKRWLFILQGNANISTNKLDIARQDLTQALQTNIEKLRLSTITLDEFILTGALSVP